MGLMDFFKKTGMLKSGSSSYKGNAQDRPTEMNDDPTPISGSDNSSDSAGTDSGNMDE